MQRYSGALYAWLWKPTNDKKLLQLQQLFYIKSASDPIICLSCISSSIFPSSLHFHSGFSFPLNMMKVILLKIRRETNSFIMFFWKHIYFCVQALLAWHCLARILLWCFVSAVCAYHLHEMDFILITNTYFIKSCC